METKYDSGRWWRCNSRPSKRKNVDNIKSLRAIPWVFAWTQIRLMLPAWLGTGEALKYSSVKKFKSILVDMERNWPFFNSTMDILDMVISKVDPEISKVYESKLAAKTMKLDVRKPSAIGLKDGGGKFVESISWSVVIIRC